MKRTFKNPEVRSQRLSQKLKGKLPWNKGRKMTSEEKKKQNISGLEIGRGLNKGKTGIYSEKTVKKMRDAKLGNKFCVGRKYSQETIGKMRKNCGHPMSETEKKRMSGRMKGKEYSLGRPPWNKGKHYPQVAGERNKHWKGGITPINLAIRASLEYKLWRIAVFERDDYTCQKYGVRGGKLIAHHIKNFADFPELRSAIDNGITLSEKAHKEFHKEYGIKNNSREQLLEFLT